MTKIISLPELLNEQSPTPKKPIQFTHALTGGTGWIKTDADPSSYTKVIYLGRCSTDGDMFAAYSWIDINDCWHITIFKGHYNDGTL